MTDITERASELPVEQDEVEALEKMARDACADAVQTNGYDPKWIALLRKGDPEALRTFNTELNVARAALVRAALASIREG